MRTLLDRFLRYVQVDTQASEFSQTTPSSLNQLDLCQMLVIECRELGLSDAAHSLYGVVTATIPATPDCTAPTIAWVAHVDTSPETTGANVRPMIHRNYSGGDIQLDGDPSKVIRVEDNPELKTLIGKTLITTDGTTLLGADDKAGVAVIMSAAAELTNRTDVRHGPIKLVFTCDEEIGHGVDHIDLRGLNAVCAYTLDGSGSGEIDCETFSADLAIVTVTGVNIHPSIGKGRMVNAIRILSQFLAQLPHDRLAPENTEGREGFLHPYRLEGGVASARVQILLRDFETENLNDYALLLESIAAELRSQHTGASIQIELIEQYRNMREGLYKEPRALAKAEAAMWAAGLEPKLSIIRGGTDGSRLTALGLPTPNLSTGEHNPHSLLEWTCLEEMETAVAVLVQLAREWGREVN